MIDFSTAKILVIGDAMLDIYWQGPTQRISPEAPVPVVNIQEKTVKPGGAANVATNLASLGVDVTLFGILGQDSQGQILQTYLKGLNVKTQFDIQNQAKTITKTRILSRDQQLLRLDEEEILNFDPFYWDPIYAAILKHVDLIILSDYNKGMLSDPQFWIQSAKKAGKMVLVDPKKNDWSVYRGADAVTPNLGELSMVLKPEEDPKILLKRYELKKLVITKSEAGISLIDQKNTYDFPAQVHQVSDVTGAGDTVVATLAACLGIGLPWPQAVEYANLAGGIAVGKLGAVNIHPHELIQAIQKTKHLFIKNSPIFSEIVSEAELKVLIQTAKDQGETIVFTNGCFDILHAGHVLYLNQAKALGQRLIVAVNTDASIKSLKGDTRPINRLNERMQVLAGLKAVDWVIAFDEETPENLIRSLNPDILVKGGDYSDLQALPGAQYLLKQNKVVKILGLQPGCSTSLIINKVLNTRAETF
ncbi:MAG: bifunctional D-glycero-beta-D-manno-heptose-7-phosphate kinase/D-glycero-beta-D-manno-heptose 1-phosphate adenylyltransferase HldE [Gammaproteobacteria bacterium]